MNRSRNPTSALFTLAALVVAVAALYFAKEIFLPLALAILLSFLLTPLCDRLERWGLGRVPSVISVVGVAFVVLGMIGWIVMSQLVDLSAKLPNYRENVVAKIREATPRSETFDRMSKTFEDVKQEIIGDNPTKEESADDSAKSNAEAATDAKDGQSTDQAKSDEAESISAESWFGWASPWAGDAKREGPVDVRVVGTAPSPLSQIYDWLGPLMAPLSTAGIAIVLVIFMLIRREDQRNRLLTLFGGANLHATTEALTDVTERVSRYLRMQFLINAGYGICVGVGLSLLGLPNGVMWGVLSFSLRFLPYVGPWLSAVMPLVVSLAIAPGWTQPMLVLAWFGILELFVNNVAEPMLYGPSIGVSGVGVIVAAVFWTWLWGPIGLVLAMPLTVCIVVLARYVPGLRFLTILLGDQPSLSIEERIYQRLLAWDVDEARELAVERLAACPLDKLYDEVLIPALRLAEQDRHAGLLTDEQEEQVQDSARDLVEETAEAARKLRSADPEAVPQEAPRNRDIRVLCIPLRDEADATSAIMLKQLLAIDGIKADVSSVQSLTGELVEAVEAQHIDVVVVSVLPPVPPRNSRLLCRRLRDRFPELPIIVGCWSGVCSKEMQDRLAATGDAEIFGTLADAAQRVRAIASQTAEQPLSPVVTAGN